MMTLPNSASERSVRKNTLNAARLARVAQQVGPRPATVPPLSHETTRCDVQLGGRSEAREAHRAFPWLGLVAAFRAP
jgi:hypothetical protein